MFAVVFAKFTLLLVAFSGYPISLVAFDVVNFLHWLLLFPTFLFWFVYQWFYFCVWCFILVLDPLVFLFFFLCSLLGLITYNGLGLFCCFWCDIGGCCCVNDFLSVSDFDYFIFLSMVLMLCFMLHGGLKLFYFAYFLLRFSSPPRYFMLISVDFNAFTVFYV